MQGANKRFVLFVKNPPCWWGEFWYVPFAGATMTVRHVRPAKPAAVFTSNLCNVRPGKMISNKSDQPETDSADGPPESGSAR